MPSRSLADPRNLKKKAKVTFEKRSMYQNENSGPWSSQPIENVPDVV